MKRRLVADGLSREDITEARIAALAKELARDLGATVLSFEARERSRRETLARLPAGEPLWIFGYGSLMWNPALLYDATRPALLHGYHRSFCLWIPAGRGTPECPGLMLALRPGGRCRGLALRIAPDLVEQETQVVWRREMLVASYIPRWVTLATDDGRLTALTFVIDTRHPRYAGRLDEATMVASIADAAGRLGRCRDYLNNLVWHLDQLGVVDGPMHRLMAKVEARVAARRDRAPAG